MNETKITIYVACHHKFIPQSDLDTNLFKYILCGKAIYDPENDTGKKGSRGWIPQFGDDTGDNISRLNRHFCEMTAAYWIWKNDNESEYVGLNHYRRYFTMNDDDTLFITRNDILNNLNTYDFMVHGCSSDYTHWYSHDYSIYQGYKGVHNPVTFDLALESCKHLYPDMYDAIYYESIENSAMCLGNLMCCKKSLFDEYCSMLFPILFEVEDRLDYDNIITDSYSQRAIGFFSERFLRIYLTVKKYTYKDQPVLDF